MTTQSEPQTFDQILEQTFPKDIQQKRIRKELISLNDLDQNFYKINLQTSALGLKVVVEFTQLFVEQEIQQNSNLQYPIILELLLDPQFPFNLPKLFCRTNIYDPSLADGRDFLEDAIERPWSPTILLREVITTIPVFLKKVNKLRDPEESQKMGRYYVGDLYSLEDLLGYETVNLFTADEVTEPSKTTAPRYIMIAESHIVKFETADNSRNTLRLLTWANVNSIANIKRSKKDDKSIQITFIDKEKTSGISQVMLLTKEANRLEELLLDFGSRYGVDIKQGAISDFDLAPYKAKLSRQITEKNVEETLEDIHVLETRLELDVTKDLVYTLMAFYQKIVEHFATYDDPLVDEFVAKLRSLMEREDVQNALKNNQEQEERQRTQPLTKQKSMDTDIEDEEEEKKESGEPYSWQDQDENLSLDGNDKVVISKNKLQELQKPVAEVQDEEVKGQEDEWNEYESRPTEEEHHENIVQPQEIIEHKEEEIEPQYQPQENIEYRQEEAPVEPQVQVQEEVYVPAQEEVPVEQKEQEEQREEVFENQQEQEEIHAQVQEEKPEENVQEEVEVNKQEEEAYVPQEEQVQEEKPEENVQEEEVNIQAQEEVAVNNEEAQGEEKAEEQQEEFVNNQENENQGQQQETENINEEEVAKVEEETVEQPAEPVVEEQAAEPVVEEQVAEPVVQEQAVEPVVEEEQVVEPVVEEQVAEPVVEEEQVAEPVVEEKPTEPVTEQQAIVEPVVEEKQEEVSVQAEEEVIENKEEQEVKNEEVVEKQEENKNEEEVPKEEEVQQQGEEEEGAEDKEEEAKEEESPETQGTQEGKKKKKKNKKKAK